jgi:hypothetical protein
MSHEKLIAVLIVLVTGIFAASSGSFAAKGGGKPPPPPPPPPAQCEDEFPGFLYQVEATRRAPAELHIASTDACRTERVAVVPNLRQAAFHMTADRSAGVIVWGADIDNQYIVRRLDFTVDNSGNLVPGLEQPVTILPLAGEEANSGDHIFYFSPDIWGDAAHDLLYLTVLRMYSINSGPDAGGGSREVLIYDLNDLTGDLAGPAPDQRLIFNLTKIPGEANQYGDWLDADPMNLRDCPTVGYPQYVPTCYLPEELKFNASGTRLYSARNITDRNGDRWDSALRVNIDSSGGGDLADWTLSGPELVYTSGPNDTDLSGILARPDNDVSIRPSPEQIAVFHRSGGSVTEEVSILDTDQCAAGYVPYAAGATEAPFNLWQDCLDTGTFFTGTVPGRSDSWQSPDALIRSSFGKKDYDLYRTYVSGDIWGTEELLIETARFADGGQ